jgi:hypothetical protein
MVKFSKDTDATSGAVKSPRLQAGTSLRFAAITRSSRSMIGSSATPINGGVPQAVTDLTVKFKQRHRKRQSAAGNIPSRSPFILGQRAQRQGQLPSRVEAPRPEDGALFILDEVSGFFRRAAHVRHRP